MRESVSTCTSLCKYSYKQRKEERKKRSSRERKEGSEEREYDKIVS